MQVSSNRTFDEIQVGETLTLSRQLSEMEVETLALVSGQVDTFHLDQEGSARDNGNGDHVSANSVGGEAMLARLAMRLPRHRNPAAPIRH